jgi:hypothetical protein
MVRRHRSFLSFVRFLFLFGLTFILVIHSEVFSQHESPKRSYQAPNQIGDSASPWNDSSSQIYQFASSGIYVKAYTDKADYLVGDYITYTIQIGYKKDVKIHAPVLSDSVKDVSIIKSGSSVIEQEKKQNIATYRYVLSCYDSAKITIPPAKVPYQIGGDTTIQYAFTNPVSINVRTLPVNLSKDIMDIKRPIKIPLNWKWILLLAMLALFVVGGGVYLYEKYRKRKSSLDVKKEVVKLPPHEVALKALHDLEEQRLWQKGAVKEYHSAITEIIRRYFEDRFNLPALELTTSETLDLIREQEGSKPILETTFNFLSNADLVKFAKFTPIGSVNEEMMKQAYEIVNRTIPSSENGKNANVPSGGIVTDNV